MTSYRQMPTLRGSRSSQSGVTPAQVAELVDALASGASGGNSVEVRVLSWAPIVNEGRLNGGLRLFMPSFRGASPTTVRTERSAEGAKSKPPGSPLRLRRYAATLRANGLWRGLGCGQSRIFFSLLAAQVVHHVGWGERSDAQHSPPARISESSPNTVRAERSAEGAKSKPPASPLRLRRYAATLRANGGWRELGIVRAGITSACSPRRLCPRRLCFTQAVLHIGWGERSDAQQ